MNAMDIIREVAAKHGVTPEALRSRQLKNILAPLRREAYQRLRTERKLSYAQIGFMFDGRNHTSIVHALDPRRPIYLREQYERKPKQHKHKPVSMECGTCNKSFMTRTKVHHYCCYECKTKASNTRLKARRWKRKQRLTEAGARAAMQPVNAITVPAGAGPDFQGTGMATGVQNGNQSQGSKTGQVDGATAHVDIRTAGHGQNDTRGGIPEHGVPTS